MIDSFTEHHAFLSNFQYATVNDDMGLSYPTVEHAYQAAKTKDILERIYIRDAKTPGIAKRMGKQIILRDDWNIVRRKIMLDFLRQKFDNRHKSLIALLLRTEHAELIEGNTWHDNYWGACSCMACESEIKHNWLGKLLMFVRLEIQIENGIE